MPWTSMAALRHELRAPADVIAELSCTVQLRRNSWFWGSELGPCCITTACQRSAAMLAAMLADRPASHGLHYITPDAIRP